MKLPEVGSLWYRREPNDTVVSKIVCITNLEHLSEELPPQIVYRDVDGTYWSMSVEQWPGSLKPLTSSLK